jgi:hypothetical protein
MSFKHNYFNELPNDIQEKIGIIVNKSKFNNCLKDIDNPKIRLFYKFNKMTTDNEFDLNYAVSDLEKLGWFWENHKNPRRYCDDDNDDYYEDEEKLFAIYDLFERDKRLSYKEYTKVLPEYTDIKYYRFKYTNSLEFRSWEIPDINSFVKKQFILNNYAIEKSNIIIKRMTFKRNHIHIYINKGSYKDNTAIDIAYNISHIYNVINECIVFLNDNYFLPFDNTINYLETNSYLESFEIKDKVLTTIFSN